jgi:hypothetical protein
MEITYTQLLLRRIAILLIFVGFCLLPGPRTLLTDIFGFLLQPSSIASFEAGLHLSVIHFCWLFGLSMPAWEYPEHVDSHLAAFALVISLIIQIGLVLLGIYFWRGAMHWYYTRKALLEERAEFGDFET